MILQVKNLSIDFYDHDFKETAVYDFNLDLAAGEIVGIVGESGSGKSLSALAIAGLLHRKDMKKSGEILFENVDLLSCSRKQLRQFQGKDIGIAFQEPMTALNPVIKIGKQVEETLKLHTTMSKQERYEKVIDMLTQVEIKDEAVVYNKYPHEISGGMRQRVMLAQAMILEPKILIADEITTALDVTVSMQIIRLLEELCKKTGTSVLFISHDLSLIKKICNRVIVMEQGKVVEQGRLEDLFYHPQEEYTKKLLAAIPSLQI